MAGVLLALSLQVPLKNVHEQCLWEETPLAWVGGWGLGRGREGAAPGS